MTRIAEMSSETVQRRRGARESTAREGRVSTPGGQVATCALLLPLLLLAGCGSRHGAEPSPATAPPPDTLPPLAHPPLDPPLEVTATFGEYRRAHFHAGLDFSTDMMVGRPVYAPLDGWVERVHTSGAGYGRALALGSADGRTVLLGHLDAFEEPVASWLAAVQDSTQQYEQDLRPEVGRFPVWAGDRVAWSGESGAGPPHLHMEVRWGDMAYNPLRYGLALPDSTPPELRRVTLEPMDSESYVDRSAAPRTYSLAGAPDTIVVEGRVRLWLEAMDGVSDPWARVAPYSARLESDSQVVECRFDRVMWDDDMTAAEWVYDVTGRASPGRAIALWVEEDYRPKVYELPGGEGATGVLSFPRGAPARTVVVAAADAVGNRSEAQLIVRGPRSGEVGPGARPVRRAPARRRGFELFPAALGHIRVSYAGAPPASREVAIGWEGSRARPASFDGARWTVLIPIESGHVSLIVSGKNAAGAAWQDRHPIQLIALAPGQTAAVSVDGIPGALWSLPADGVFSRAFVTAETVGVPAPAPGLAPLGPSFGIESGRLPLRRAATVVVPLPGSSTGDRAGIYVEQDGVWDLVGSERRQNGRALSGEVRALGRYALYADVEAPHIGLARTRHRARGAPHARWWLQCGIVERGSGIDPARTHFVVDGRRVPSEWEIERAVLRWRPLHPPPAGAHRYEVVATDAAGNVSRQSGVFAVR